jgi:hypothetical protein
MKEPMKSHAAICGLSFAFYFCNCLQGSIRWEPFALKAQPLDTSPLRLCPHSKMLLPAKLPQCPVRISAWDSCNTWARRVGLAWKFLSSSSSSVQVVYGVEMGGWRERGTQPLQLCVFEDSEEWRTQPPQWETKILRSAESTPGPKGHLRRTRAINAKLKNDL